MDISTLLAGGIYIGAVIAGVNEALKRARAKDWFVFTTILSSALIGLIFGLFHLQAGPNGFVVTPVEGLIAGFALSGLFSFVGSIGNRSVPAPSSAVTKTV